MSWDNLLRRCRSVRIRLTAAYTLAALAAAALALTVLLSAWSFALNADLDRALTVQWRTFASEISAQEGFSLASLPPGVYAATLKPGGRDVLALSPAAQTIPILFMKPRYGRRGQRADREGFWRQTTETGTPKRHFRICAKPLPDGTLLAVAQDLRSHDFIHQRLLWFALGGFLLMALFLLLFAALLAKRLFRGFGHAVKTVEAMAAGDFSCRVPTLGRGEELEHLTRAVNTLADNTERLLADLRTVTDNIAHDLRTPITRLRTRAELALPAGGETAALAGEVAEECNNMLELISALLEIARVGHNIGVGPGEPCDLAALARELIECFAILAETKAITLQAELPERLDATTCAPLLRRALANLLDNALKFTPAHGTVTFSLTSEHGHPTFRVSDTGCGIAPEERERLFQRFYRADSSRALPGFGLGLALVAAIAQALHAEVSLEHAAPGQGASFRFTL
ncbi:MAG: sensor histidine kinase [Candidatus Spyradenecus sp.]